MSRPDKYYEMSRKLLAQVNIRERKLAEFTAPIAVVGLACRFPGGYGAEGFWRLLESGGDAVTEGRGRPLEGSWTGPGAFVEDLDLFDAEFFRIAPVEARSLDPQHRLLLETTWEAVESAKMDAARLKGSRAGVYMGISGNEYRELAADAEEKTTLHLGTGNSASAAAGRVAFTLGLEGPAVAVDTWCSSSLVAIHHAVSSLRNGDADLALAGGVSALLASSRNGNFLIEGMLSPQGRCRTFDASADGFVGGEGCGVLVLKRLRDAEADGDGIWGVIRGSAVNHDGASAGLTVPNGPAQERVIRDALRRAGLEPAAVDYLEAHGTGTPLGDPIEINAACAVYGAGRDPAQPLRVGSAKTNIGHLSAASGVAGLIKVLLSMAHGVIPKHLHFREPTPHVDWERLPLRVVSEAEQWPRREGCPARAAVSSFGASGTNAHLVLEGYGETAGPDDALLQAGPAAVVGWPESASAYRPGDGETGVPAARERRVLPLSGRTEGAVRELAGRYLEWLDERAQWLTPGGSEAGSSGPAAPELLADMAWTAGVGRSHHPCRAALTFGEAGELRDKLAALTHASGVPAGIGVKTKAAFLFAGYGSQWVGMGRDIYDREPVFRAVLDRCERAFRDLRGASLLDAAFGDAAGVDLKDPTWGHPAVYAVQTGLTALLASAGIRPFAVMGYSLGEIAAAHVAGVFSLEDGLRFAALRGELMASLVADPSESGHAVSVYESPDRVSELMEEVNREHQGMELSVAAYAGAYQVVAGAPEVVAALQERCVAEGVRAERLPVNVGFHSAVVDPILDGLEEAMEGVAVSPPSLAMVSNVTGRVFQAGETLDGAYWRRQAREPVRFSSGVVALTELGVDVLVDVGPQPRAGLLATTVWPTSPPPAVVVGMKRPSEDDAGALPGWAEVVAEAYATGLDVEFEGLFAGEGRRRVSLPGYPFQRRRYWADPPRRRRRVGEADHPLLGERRDSAGGETTFETELYASEPAWLQDHRVFGQVAAPGALYGAMALSAAVLSGEARSEGSGAAVEEMWMHAPLVLPGERGKEKGETGRAVQVVVSAADGSGRRGVNIYSKGDDGEKWTLHAEAWAAWADEAEAVEAVDLEGLKEGLRELEVSAFYRALGETGVELGASFRTVAELWTGSGEAVGEVRLAEGLAKGESGLHPALLDGCFQILAAAFGAGAWEAGSFGEEPPAMYLPFGWERLWIRGGEMEGVTCRARVREGENRGVRSADLWMYGTGGQCVGLVKRLALKRVSHGAIPSGGVRTDDLVYVPEWREGARGVAELAEGEGAPDGAEKWVLSSDAGQAGLELAKELVGRDERVLLAVEEGWGHEAEAGAAGVDVVRLDLRSRESWRGLLEGVVEEGGGVRGVVHLGGMRGHGAAADGEELAADVGAALGSGLGLVQGLLDAGVSPEGGVWLATRGGQVLGGETGGGLSGSVMWGFGRTLRREARRLGARLVDLDPAGGEAGGMGELAEDLLAPDREREIAYRGGVRRVLRLARAGGVGKESSGGGALLRRDGTYLVTGGLRGIGLEVARWLGDQGAGKIVLNARREPGAEAQAVIEELRGRGVEVRVELADVTDGDAVAAMVERVEEEMGPLAGVIHSAAVLSDGALENQDWERFERVLWPKVKGAWHLHRATAGRELDLFVLFSSVTGLMGNPGQSSYAAANAYLDQLARCRREMGLAGQSIVWGAWSGVGQAEAWRELMRERMAAAGVGWMTPRQGLGVLERAIRGGEATIAAMPVDWELFGTVAKDVPLLEDLMTAAAGAGGGEIPADQAAALVERLRAARPVDREGMVLEFVQGELQAVLQAPSPPAPATRFFELGMDSLMALEFRERLNRGLGDAYEVAGTAVFDHPSPEAFARHLVAELGLVVEEPRPLPSPRRRAAARGEDAVAVVGMACRFPGSPDLAGFWRLLESGGDAVTAGRERPPEVSAEPPVPDERLWGGYIEDVDLFDARFFGIPPVEARHMDPQQRLLLETSWTALESAGMDPGSLRGSRTGTYVGISANDYRYMMAGGEEAEFSPYLITGNGLSMAIGRLAFTLGFEGPAVAVDTACSSSLVAVHQAVSALQRDEADLALAAGVNVILWPARTAMMKAMGALAADGRCKTFDASADGYVRSEGCGVVALKRLRDAEAEGVPIWGVIRGSAVNHGGAAAAGMMVPSGPAQERLIGEALGRAQLDPSDVDYLEAHGIGTLLGDPIEVQAAAAAYGRGRGVERPLLLGSVKTNIGHPEPAAGVASLIKVLLAMAHGTIPRHLHFREPNPHVQWDRLPVRVVSEAMEWPSRDGLPVRAGVSSFGLSGTNAHVVVEGYGDASGPAGLSGAAVPVGWPAGVPESPSEAASSDGVGTRVHRLLVLSGNTGEALQALAGRYVGWLDACTDSLSSTAGEDGFRPDGADLLADAAWTAATGRFHLPHRAGVTFTDVEQLRARLSSLSSGEPEASGVAVGSGAADRAAFLFPGEGSQWAGMGRDLYESEPVFRAVLDRCEQEMRALRGESLLDVMFGTAERSELDHARWAQPAVFALESGLAALWAGVGVTPFAVLGQGLGEVAAAYVAGAFSLEDGLRFAASRGEWTGSPSPVPEDLERLLERVAVSPLELPVVSGLTGRVMEAGEVLDGLYWSRQAREAVAFESATVALAKLAVDVLVEVGPQPVLGAAAASAWPVGTEGPGRKSRAPSPGREAAARTPLQWLPLLPDEADEFPVVLSSLRREKAKPVGGAFVEAVAAAYAAGLKLRFEGLFVGEKRRRLSLPEYPFQRRRYWVDPPKS